MKVYAAYWSNINIEQMAFRCPAAQVIGKGWLMNYQLMFLSISRGRGGVATVEPHKGRRVPILLWAISPDCEAALDQYEGWPHLYRKETLPVNGITWMLNDITSMPAEVTEVPSMIYIMNQGTRLRQVSATWTPLSGVTGPLDSMSDTWRRVSGGRSGVK